MILRQPYDQLLLEIISQGRDDLEKAGPRGPSGVLQTATNPTATIFLGG